MELVKTTKNESGVWIVELNRAEKLNALSLQLIDEATQIFGEAHSAALKSELKTLILASTTDKSFCVGADLKERKAMSDEQVIATLDRLKKLTLAIENIPCPTIAAIDGAAFGGGLELALCCDLRIVSPGATMGLTETRLAIIPGAGGTQRLARYVGLAKAKELIFTGRRLSGNEALSIGLANACVENPKDESKKWAEEIVQGGPIALLAAKKAIDNGYGKSIEEGLVLEREAYLSTLKTKDRVEGLRAFEEKRKPKYEGK